MAERVEAEAAAAEGTVAPSRPGALAAFLALLVPGLGHFYLGRRARSVVFFALVVASLVIGTSLEGNLYTPVPGHPLTWLATLGTMGTGVLYFALLLGVGYLGDITAPGFEYGTAFILSAGLMNLLLVLDAWDIATGRKA